MRTSRPPSKGTSMRQHSSYYAFGIGGPGTFTRRSMLEGRSPRPPRSHPGPVRWAELLPLELRARRAVCPLAWLPMGLCEPHGYIAAFGLDTIKADWLCDKGARLFGGVVAPTQGWHIHETGYHARWLEEVVGEGEAELGSLPPDVLLRTFLYQLRALAN